MTESKLTVFFEEPFWVGIYERENNGKYEACKITFGSEPKDYEVYEFVLKNWNNLKFSPSIKSDGFKEKRISPKRMQRLINKQLENTGIASKAQQALKLQHQLVKSEYKIYTRQKREDNKQRRFELKQQKHKQKHRGH